MVTAIGVLCARVRVEEKQIITALGDAGAVAMPVPPTGMPLPPNPTLQDLAALGNESALASESATASATASATTPAVIIDRCANRSVATVMLRILRSGKVGIIDAGLASTGTRLDVAIALTQVGIPRPHALVGFSEPSGIRAAVDVGFPSTVLPLTPGSTTTTLLDEDTADAVIEHRVVLGNRDEAIVLVQAGAPNDDGLMRVHVVGGRAITIDWDSAPDEAVRLAERAADAIGASFVAIDVASVKGELVVWDAVPVADFRQATLLGTVSIGEALVSLAMTLADRVTTQADWKEAHRVIALTA